MKTKFVLMAVLLSFLSGCVTPPPKLNTSKPVEFEGALFKPSLSQDGTVIDEFSAHAHFATLPEAQAPTSNARTLFWSSVAASGVAGWFIGTWLGHKDHPGGSLAVGAGMLGVSFMLMHFQKQELGKASDVYNSSFKTKKKSAMSIEPGIAPVDGGGIAGVVIGY